MQKTGWQVSEFQWQQSSIEQLQSTSPAGRSLGPPEGKRVLLYCFTICSIFACASSSACLTGFCP